MDINERLIARVENAIAIGAPVEDIAQMLKGYGLTGYNAWLAYKAGEVSLRMRERTYVENK